MTTKSIKPVVRETSAYVRDRGMRPIIATIEHGILKLRAKGLRTEEVLDIGSLYHQAVKARVFNEKRQKIAERKARRGGRR